MNAHALTSYLLEDDFDPEAVDFDLDAKDSMEAGRVPGCMAVLSWNGLMRTEVVDDVGPQIAALLDAGAKPKVTRYRVDGVPRVQVPVRGWTEYNGVVEPFLRSGLMQPHDVQTVRLYNGVLSKPSVYSMWFEITVDDYQSAFGEIRPLAESEEPDLSLKSLQTDGEVIAPTSVYISFENGRRVELDGLDGSLFWARIAGMGRYHQNRRTTMTTGDLRQISDSPDNDRALLSTLVPTLDLSQAVAFMAKIPTKTFRSLGLSESDEPDWKAALLGSEQGVDTTLALYMDNHMGFSKIAETQFYGADFWLQTRPMLVDGSWFAYPNIALRVYRESCAFKKGTGAVLPDAEFKSLVEAYFPEVEQRDLNDASYLLAFAKEHSVKRILNDA